MFGPSEKPTVRKGLTVAVTLREASRVPLARPPCALRGSQDCTQRPYTGGLVRRNSEALVAGLLSLQHDVAALLVDDPVAPMSAKDLDEFVAAQIARELHRLASTSSRTR